jgi:hypothetical protein
MQSGVALNFQSFCLHRLSAGFLDLCYHSLAFGLDLRKETQANKTVPFLMGTRKVAKGHLLHSGLSLL